MLLSVLYKSEDYSAAAVAQSVERHRCSSLVSMRKDLIDNLFSIQ